mmetsp:Transcript_34875/g.110164  ORF Transcript_34875/g.110164 Transcript_34875/m.110164 type:complete len:304 (+) Transcript_34875:1020-1931(+)
MELRIRLVRHGQQVRHLEAVELGVGDDLLAHARVLQLHRLPRDARPQHVDTEGPSLARQVPQPLLRRLALGVRRRHERPDFLHLGHELARVPLGHPVRGAGAIEVLDRVLELLERVHRGTLREVAVQHGVILEHVRGEVVAEVPNTFGDGAPVVLQHSPREVEERARVLQHAHSHPLGIHLLQPLEARPRRVCEVVEQHELLAVPEVRAEVHHILHAVGLEVHVHPPHDQLLLVHLVQAVHVLIDGEQAAGVVVRHAVALLAQLRQLRFPVRRQHALVLRRQLPELVLPRVLDLPVGLLEIRL